MIIKCTNTLTFEEKYNAIGRQDTQYEGVFITGVKSTGIFCRPSCRARKPKAENVVFFDTTQQALQYGLRPCKVCKPMEQLDETPQYVTDLVQELHADPYLWIKDYDLRKRGVEPSHIRRWFKKHHNMTFHSYQRLLRVNAAFNSIHKGGETVTNAALDSGYNSLSGFNEGYRSIFGSSATAENSKNVINIVRFTSPIGPMFACATDQGVCLLEFTDRRMLETEFKDLRKRLNAVILPGQHPHLDQLQSELVEYFSGKRQRFTVPLHTPGTEFQQAVWEVLKQIPYGETRTYKQQAAAINNPKAVRAVASANGKNRVGILIPCHRVIGSDGTLVGYGGGLYRKKWLLDLESQVAG
ncbi:MAG: methylated-DNA--[protein]-cysteine S-methyltransferase [Proteobacteria bacterium]|nr:methylated-DNA--[protein]-cysteine S-methyltransferase [Pseudomonadota bacterium]